MLNNDSHRFSMLFVLMCIFNMIAVNRIEARTIYTNLEKNHEIISKYEHGGQGYQAIAKDSYKGYSYGKWQISTERRNDKPSTFDFFLQYTKEKSIVIYEKLINAGGQEKAFVGDENFINVWKKLATLKEFQEIYDNFIFDTQVIPVYQRMDNSKNIKLDLITTWSSDNKAIQAAIKSIIIQHGMGGAYNMLNNVMITYNPQTKDAFLEKLYEYRTARFPKYKKRYLAEYQDLSVYLNSKESVVEQIKYEYVYTNLVKSYNIIYQLLYANTLGNIYSRDSIII